MRKYQLPLGMTIVLNRHGATDNNPVDADRKLSEGGKTGAAIVADILVKKGITPDVVVVSPAYRCLQTANIVYPEVKRLEYAPLFDFAQFPNCDTLYMDHGTTNPSRYMIEDSKEIGTFQEELYNFLVDNDVWKENITVAIVSHAIITNFQAVMLSDENIAYDQMLPGGACFVINEKGIELITAD